MLDEKDIDGLIAWCARALFGGVSPLRIRDHLRGKGLNESELDLVYKAAVILFED